MKISQGLIVIIAFIVGCITFVFAFMLCIELIELLIFPLKNTTNWGDMNIFKQILFVIILVFSIAVLFICIKVGVIVAHIVRGALGYRH